MKLSSKKSNIGTSRPANKNITKYRWSKKDQILFFERLELYISSGLSLDKSLQISAEGSSSKQREILIKICDYVQGGNTFAHALSLHTKISPTIVGLLEHGERSAGLNRSIDYCKQLLEREEELKKKCISAMIYPIVIGFFALVLTIGLVKGVMPQIIPMLKSLHIKLPLLTIVVMNISNFINAYFVHIIIVTILSIAIFYYINSKSKRIRDLVQNSAVRIPLLGYTIYTYYLSIFLRSLGSMIESGLTLEQAYNYCLGTIDFQPLHKQFSKYGKIVKEGIMFAVFLANIRTLPKFVAPLISAGERTASLGNSLVRCAIILDRDIENFLKRITSLIEPLMMIFIGSIIGSIALSIIMPIYDISKNLQH